MTLPEPIGWPEMLLIDLLNRRRSLSESEAAEWFDDAWPEPYIEFAELGLVEGIDYEECDDGSTWLGVEAGVRLTEMGRHVAEAARNRSESQPIGVFVLSIDEDSALVNEMCTVLANAGVRVWRHIQQLSSKYEWKPLFSKAIESGIGVVACYSGRVLKPV